MKRKYFPFPLLMILILVILLPCEIVIVKAIRDRYNPFGAERQKKYTLYIGLSDGDTQEQKFTAEEAKQIMYDISRKFTDGYTIYDARGYWYEEDKDRTFSENTLVCVLFDIEPENVKNIMDEAIKAFNQNSILLEVDTVRREFYSNK